MGENETLKCLIDFDDMTTSIAGCDWATAVRRWDRDVPMGDSWDHQDDDVSIVDVQTASRDYAVVATAFFERQRPDGRTPLISHGTQTVPRCGESRSDRCCRCLRHTGRICTESGAKKDMVELTCQYAWHGSGMTQPDSIAAG